MLIGKVLSSWFFTYKGRALGNGGSFQWKLSFAFSQALTLSLASSKIRS